MEVQPYMRYLCKGDSAESLPDVVCHQGLEYTSDQIKLWHEAFWVNRAEIDSSRQARKRISGATAAEKVLEICRHRQIRWTQVREIFKVYINLCMEGNKGISTFAAKSIVRIVQLKLCPDSSALDYLVDELSMGFCTG
jgi:hypothetical protein